jgi:hypothetical protein
MYITTPSPRRLIAGDEQPGFRGSSDRGISASASGCPDGLSAMRRYGEIHGQDPRRELYVLHTDRETVEVEEAHWGGIRAAS